MKKATSGKTVKSKADTVYVNLPNIGYYVNINNEMVSLELLEEGLSRLDINLARVQAWVKQCSPENKLIEVQLGEMASWLSGALHPKVEVKLETIKKSLPH